MEDNIIIKYISQKNEEGLELLIERYGGLIVSIVRKHLLDFEDMHEECVDDILLAIWNNVKGFDEEKNTFKNWIGAISKYKAIDFKRKALKRPIEEEIQENYIESTVSIEENLLLEELRDEVKDIMENLPSKDREIFRRYYLEEKDMFEIGRELFLKPSVIYNRLSRGRKKLKSLFKGTEYL